VLGERARARGYQVAKRRRPRANPRLPCARMTATGRLAPLLLAAQLVACGPATVEHPPPAPSSARPEPKDEWIGALGPQPPPPPRPGGPAPPAPAEDGAGQDFIEEARVLFRVAACAGDGPVPAGLDAALIQAHCDEIRPKIEAYKKRYVAVAKPFLSAIQPA